MAGRPESPRRKQSAHAHASNQENRSSHKGRFFPASEGVVPSGRISVVFIFFLVVALIFFGRLIYVQVIKADEWSAEAEESRTVNFPVNQRRGTIYDRNGTVLATSVDATTIYANPAEVTDPSSTATVLASVLGGEKKDYEALLTQDKTTFVYIKRQADVELAEEVESWDLKGIYFIADTRREYPCGRIAGQIVGYCNVDGEGITGLELQYDDILSGTPGVYTAERGENGIPIPGGLIEEEPAVDGQDIMISIDIELQDYVETALEERADALAAEGGSAVVMDAGTGEILAAASLPLLDPSDMSKAEVSADQLKAVTQAFEPGSIFKTVSTMAILEHETMTPDDTIFCPSEIETDGYTISDAHEREDATYSLRQILDQSSNIGISLATEKMGFEELYDSIITYNLQESTGVDYPGESSGSMQPFENWARIVGYNVSFGQGITCTPLQMVRFYGALINDGVQVTPHFLISLPQTGETPEYDTEDVIENKDAIPTMIDMLTTVVEDGTGEDAAIKGYTVAGKTGTAEIAEGGVYKEGVYNLDFVGFLPDSSSQLVCFVGVNEVYGMDTVTSTFSDIMSTAIDRFKISSN